MKKYVHAVRTEFRQFDSPFVELAEFISDTGTKSLVIIVLQSWHMNNLTLLHQTMKYYALFLQFHVFIECSTTY